MSPPAARVACIILAKGTAQRIAATVTVARDLPYVPIVILCNDGGFGLVSGTAARGITELTG